MSQVQFFGSKLLGNSSGSRIESRDQESKVILLTLAHKRKQNFEMIRTDEKGQLYIRESFVDVSQPENAPRWDFSISWIAEGFQKR
jgi:hypothetical protein